jgi:hypothetical protein
MASLIHNSAMLDPWQGNLNVADTFRIMLVTSGHSASRAHSRRNQVTNEVTGTGYTAGGQIIVPTFSVSNTTNALSIVIPQATWPSSTITARGAEVYKSRGGAASADELLCYIDFLRDVVTSNEPFTVQQSILTQQNG